MYGSSFINDNWIGNKILSNLLEACNTSTYYNSVTGLSVSDPFTGDPLAPTTGPIHIRTTVAPSDTLTADVIIDSNADFDFRVVAATIANAGANDRYAEFYDSSDPTKYLRLYWFSETLFAVSVFNGSTTAVSAVSADLSNGVTNMLGISMTGPISARVFAACANGTQDLSPATIDMTGMTLDRMIIGSRVGGTTLMDMNIFSMTSNQLGDVDFVGRMWGLNDADGNKFLGTVTTENPTGLTVELTDNPEKSAVCPYTIGAWDGTTNGAYLVDDRYLIDGTCVTVPAGYELQIINGIYQKINGEYQIIEKV